VQIGEAEDVTTTGLPAPVEGAPLETMSAAPTTSRVPAPLLVLGGIVSVQLGAAIAKQLFPRIGPEGTVMLRLVGGALLLWLAVRPTRRVLARLDLRLTLAFGAVLATMNLSFYLAIARIPLGVAVALEFLGPLAVALAGARRVRELGAAALAAVAVLLLTGGTGFAGGGPLDVGGVGFALAAGVLWAGYILLSRRVGAATPGLAGLAGAATVAAVLLLPVGIATAGARLADPVPLALGAAVGLLSAAVPYGLELVALRTLTAATFAVLRERLTFAEVAGVLLVCVASVTATRSAARQSGMRGTSLRIPGFCIGTRRRSRAAGNAERAAKSAC
jgi:inner membrane transporter RhtA